MWVSLTRELSEIAVFCPRVALSTPSSDFLSEVLVGTALLRFSALLIGLALPSAAVLFEI